MDVKVIHGDCRQVLPTMTAGSVDAIVTDPPYGTGEWLRHEAGAGKVPKAKHSRSAWDVWDTAWLNEARRVCRGPIAFFLPTREVGSAISYAETNGEPWRLMAWCKPDPMPMFTGQVSYGFEPVMVLRHKGAAGGRDWVEASTPRKGRDADGTGHPHQKPLKAVRWLCDMAPAGSLILDPFAGSGTTAVACLMTGRRCISIESDPRYIPIINRRVRDAATPLFSEGVLEG
jgi:site-specific DNA-methyltransferase (adenine-specific)